MTEARQYLTLLFTLATHITRHAIKVKDIYLSVSEQSTLRIHKHAHTHTPTSHFWHFSLNSTQLRSPVSVVECLTCAQICTHTHTFTFDICGLSLRLFYYLSSLFSCFCVSSTLSHFNHNKQHKFILFMHSSVYYLCCFFDVCFFLLCAHQSYSFLFHFFCVCTLKERVSCSVR